MVKRINIVIAFLSIWTLLCLTCDLNAQSQKKSGHTGAKNKIVVEYISFIDQFKKYEVYPWDTLKIDDFQKSYFAAISDGQIEEWVKNLSGTATGKNRMIRAFKEQFLLIVCCKPHLCDSSQTIVLFDPLTKRAYSVIARDGNFSWYGKPTPNIKDLLNILLVEEFKAIYKGQR